MPSLYPNAGSDSIAPDSYYQFVCQGCNGEDKTEQRHSKMAIARVYSRHRRCPTTAKSVYHFSNIHGLRQLSQADIDRMMQQYEDSCLFY